MIMCSQKSTSKLCLLESGPKLFLKEPFFHPEQDMSVFLLMATFTCSAELTMKKDLTTCILIACAKTDG